MREISNSVTKSAAKGLTKKFQNPCQVLPEKVNSKSIYIASVHQLLPYLYDSLIVLKLYASISATALVS